jgi:hypothetical protein
MPWSGRTEPATLAFAALTPHTAAGRVAVVILAVAILIATLALAGRLGSAAFFYGFLVAVGVFLSLDIVLVHWIFRLHRITAGPEANIIEPILVLAGVGFVVYGLRRELRSRRARRDTGRIVTAHGSRAHDEPEPRGEGAPP